MSGTWSVGPTRGSRAAPGVPTMAAPLRKTLARRADAGNSVTMSIGSAAGSTRLARIAFAVRRTAAAPAVSTGRRAPAPPRKSRCRSRSKTALRAPAVSLCTEWYLLDALLGALRLALILGEEGVGP